DILQPGHEYHRCQKSVFLYGNLPPFFAPCLSCFSPRKYRGYKSVASIRQPLQRPTPLMHPRFPPHHERAQYALQPARPARHPQYCLQDAPQQAGQLRRLSWICVTDRPEPEVLTPRTRASAPAADSCAQRSCQNQARDPDTNGCPEYLPCCSPHGAAAETLRPRLRHPDTEDSTAS